MSTRHYIENVLFSKLKWCFQHTIYQNVDYMKNMKNEYVVLANFLSLVQFGGVTLCL